MDGEGTLSVYFSESSYAQTKASADIPDTGAFLLKITDSAGKVIYDGRYGDSPEKLIVKAGTYNISVRSTKFSKPAFSAPEFVSGPMSLCTVSFLFPSHSARARLFRD